MTKINRTQYIEGKDFYHRCFRSGFETPLHTTFENYSPPYLVQYNHYINEKGRDAVILSSHAYFGFLGDLRR